MGSRSARELLRCAELLRSDAREVIEQSDDFALHLDLVAADIEFARVLGDRPHAELWRSWRRALELLGSTRAVGPWLYGGAAQAGWTAIALGTPPPAAVDDVVLRWIADYPSSSEIDLLRGLLGLGVYVLAHPNTELRERATNGVLDVIDARAERDGDGLFLRLPDTPLHRWTGLAGYRLLGAAHGAAGLACYLATVAGSDLRCAPRAELLLVAVVQWLLRQRASVGGSRFPRSVETRSIPTRTAWCHGDPGVWLGLAAAADITGSPAIATAAANTASAVLARPPADSGVADGCLCHGAAGLVWLGSRIAASRPAGDRAVAERFVAHWVGWLVEHRAAGPLQYRRHPTDELQEREVSFLDGDLGAALALLSATSGTRPRWDRLLLASPGSASHWPTRSV